MIDNLDVRTCTRFQRFMLNGVKVLCTLNFIEKQLNCVGGTRIFYANSSNVYQMKGNINARTFTTFQAFMFNSVDVLCTPILSKKSRIVWEVTEGSMRIVPIFTKVEPIETHENTPHFMYFNFMEKGSIVWEVLGESMRIVPIIIK